MTCPYHLSLPSLIFIPNCSTLTVLLMCSFLELRKTIQWYKKLEIHTLNVPHAPQCKQNKSIPFLEFKDKAVVYLIGERLPKARPRLQE